MGLPSNSIDFRGQSQWVWQPIAFTLERNVYAIENDVQCNNSNISFVGQKIMYIFAPESDVHPTPTWRQEQYCRTKRHGNNRKTTEHEKSYFTLTLNAYLHGWTGCKGIEPAHTDPAE